MSLNRPYENIVVIRHGYDGQIHSQYNFPGKGTISAETGIVGSRFLASDTSNLNVLDANIIENSGISSINDKTRNTIEEIISHSKTVSPLLVAMQTHMKVSDILLDELLSADFPNFTFMDGRHYNQNLKYNETLRYVTTAQRVGNADYWRNLSKYSVGGNK